MSTKIMAPETPGSDDQSTNPPTSRKVGSFAGCQRFVTPGVVSKPSFCRADSNHFESGVHIWFLGCGKLLKNPSQRQTTAYCWK